MDALSRGTAGPISAQYHSTADSHLFHLGGSFGGVLWRGGQRHIQDMAFCPAVFHLLKDLKLLSSQFGTYPA